MAAAAAAFIASRRARAARRFAVVGAYALCNGMTLFFLTPIRNPNYVSISRQASGESSYLLRITDGGASVNRPFPSSFST